MPVLPKSLVVLGATFATARTARRLKHAATGVRDQQRVLAGLLPKFAATARGRELGLESGLASKTFAARAPICAYEQFSPYVERMKRGEADVLWPGRCAFYAVSSGTTAGPSKWLPITEEMVAHFRRTGLASLMFYSARVGHAGVFRGRHLFLGGSTTLAPIEESKPFVAFGGDLSGITALYLPKWVERHLYEPGAAIAQMSDWPGKIKAIAARTLHRDISLVAGIPSWLLIFAEAVRAAAARGKSRPANLQAIWPNLECLVHGGVPLAPFQEELRRVAGPTVNFHEVYPASEAFIAAQDADAASGLRLLTDAGIFFEFIPMRDFDDTLPPALGARAVPLEGVRAGEDYALVLTTPAGLCRYVIGDVVRFISTAPPRLIYVGRTKLQLSAFGEHVIEKELTDSLVAVCQRNDWTIVNFHVAPVFVNSLTGQSRGCHEWWIELRPISVATPTGPVLAAQLDAELMARNDDYAGKRKGGGMVPPVVKLVMPGFFEYWMRAHGKWGGQNKMPRCRSDREIADQLTRVACFTNE
ncbi:MAG TPA: GH3 auxin-responsive promoter family protein [Opitutus sp.]|nr:GH3 auxin-responsive promoter family protein [Opitutus sp.]